MRRKYAPVKVPTQKLCKRCRCILTKKAEVCTKCKNILSRKELERKELDASYREALIKHKMQI